MGIVEVKTMIPAMEDAPITNEVNDVETCWFLLRENEKVNDLLREAGMFWNTRY